MKTTNKTGISAVIFRWIARISSAMYLALFLFLLASSLMGESGEYTLTVPEKIAFGLMFTYFAGLLLAWKKELPGGLIAIGSTIAFAVVLRDAPNPMHGIMLTPAVLFIAAYFRARSVKHGAHQLDESLFRQESVPRKNRTQRRQMWASRW